MNRTMAFVLLLSASCAGWAQCEANAPAARCPAPARASENAAGNSAANEAVVPGRMKADPTEPAQNVEGAVYFNTSTQKHRVFRGGAWHDLGSEREAPLLAGTSPCDPAHVGKKALTVDLENAPANTFPPAPPYVANIRWATCTAGVFRGRPYWIWQ